MKQEMILVPRGEYERLKRLEILDFDLIRRFANSLRGLKHGRFHKKV